VDLYYFSFTGTSKSLAFALASKLKITPKEIKSFSFPYPIWLLLSFIPPLCLKSKFEPPESSSGILVFPKWTFNCPPVTYFLKGVSFEKLLLIILYGGWREKPYGEFYRKLALKKSKRVDIIYIKRKKWLGEGELILKKISAKAEEFF
jgi:hypothetical protein